MFTYVYTCLLILTYVYLSLLVFPYIYPLFTRVYQRLPLFAHPCLPMISRGLLLFIPVHVCLPVFTYFTRLYLCLIVFTYV